MAPTVVRDDQTTHGGTHVERVTIIRTDADAYPTGWKDTLHYAEIGGQTLLRDDNAHEPTKGYERHTPDGTVPVEFPGMTALYRRFRNEIEALSP